MISGAMQIVDPGGCILYQNPAMERAVGRPVLGRKCWETCVDDQQQCELCPLKHLLPIGETKTIEASGMLGGRSFEIHHATLPGPVLDKLRIIGRSGDNLLTILNDILDLAKIEAGRMDVQAEDFRCLGMLEEIVQLFRQPAELKQLSLALVKSGEIPQIVRADAQKIRRVLINLLGNAIKFTQTGGVEMTAMTVTGDGDQPLRLRVAVKDSGPGISPEEINRLFHKFEQTSAGRASQSGTGLGLAISQQYARLMNGNVTVESQVGHGATFVFEVLPR